MGNIRRYLLAASPLVAVLVGQACSAVDASSGSPPIVFEGTPGNSTGGKGGVRVIPTDTRAPVQAAKPPPPISGGTLLITADGTTAIASDPDRDRVVFVNLKLGTLAGVASFAPGDEPGRLVEDRAGRIHAVLRGGGAIATLDRAAHTIISKRSVCGAPRGIASDASTDTLYVACATGDLVSLPAAGGEALSRQFIASDLRDVIVQPSEIVVTRFRSAEAIHLSKAGAELARLAPTRQALSLPSTPPKQSDMPKPSFDPNNGIGGGPSIPSLFSASVAYRAIPTSGGQLLMLHQVATDSTLDISKKDDSAPSPYGSGFGFCESIVQTALTIFSGPNATPTQLNATLNGSFLGVDVAATQSGSWVAVASAGLPDPSAPQPSFEGPTLNGPPQPTSLPVGGSTSGGVTLFADLKLVGDSSFDQGCTTGGPLAMPTDTQPIAVAFSPTAPGQLVVQSREPAKLVIFDQVEVFSPGREVDLGGISVRDTGHDLFHQASGAGIACASCHPEGTEDGRVWQFSGQGARRTQSLNNGIADTQPFHWDGELSGMDKLMDEVFVRRMGGIFQSPDRLKALEHWLFGLKTNPAMRVATDLGVQRGKQLFESPQVGCTDCHAGAKLTNNQNHVVRANEPALQTPSLIGVSARAPFMHDGCALTLLARFTDQSCGGGELHGHTSTLSGAELQDLVAYLESL